MSRPELCVSAVVVDDGRLLMIRRGAQGLAELLHDNGVIATIT